MTMFGYNMLGFGAGISGGGDFYATGGNTIAGAGLDIVHTFTASGTFAVVAGETAVSYLVVAGGGAGCSGGGGAGGFLTGTELDVTSQSYTVSIGAGAAGVAVGGARRLS
jgi:hypothetical protein